MIILNEIKELMNHIKSMQCNSIEDTIYHGSLILNIQDFYNRSATNKIFLIYEYDTIEDYIVHLFKEFYHIELQDIIEAYKEERDMMFPYYDFNTRMITHLKDKGYKLFMENMDGYIKRY